ncbi:protein unc-50 homolog [Vespa mandarinia]|uniref:protein unc-50 homolog n=1 Tax=Vespa mandarinia TaxID=7446 RepID=UPI0016129AEB|nr:protein unc-50 homolog [Vespa mandarinia]XP_035743187.1 protein unc-50 homolog [Vespa mandarinia]XP_047357324.1 protein unc-50 homolog [Vespa velutina]XP_047357325.1 protein unc-50 homolog [Vespa velutina]XP_047357326.1 protein unc-50 homolog [Vespa velutina]XP_047357327.1 protein unc-50 homolog [Vespa velutina]XP_047357731.1 protein unc-50 homolog [Vespa velutina]
MKFSTSPPTSRCTSPILVDVGSTLPTPVTYRHNCISAATKCYKYLRKLLKFEQMDFEFALWQMIFLFTAPQKVYRNFQSRKQTKSQFARDDPAFLVLLTCWLCISAVGIAVVLGLGFFQFIRLLLYMIFVDYIVVGLIVATVFWFITNRYLRIDKSQDVEWGYAFDIHLNAFFPPLIILHILQLFIYNGLINTNVFGGRFVGNTLWFISVAYYIYITFLGYTSVEILHKTHIIFSALPIMLLIYIITLCSGINISRLIMDFYHYRVN